MTEAVDWIAQDDTEAAKRLNAAFRQAATLIGARPNAGRLRQDIIGERYRVWSLTSFPYLLIYNPKQNPPRIIRVIHMSRDLPAALADLRD